MTHVDQVKELLAAPGAPNILVGYEYSGGLTNALMRRGEVTLTCDERYPEHEGLHYWGDLHDICGLTHWKAAYFVGPPCYQILKGDLRCRDAKLADGRAFWGVKEVWWCITFAHADSVFVEQPDTIAHDAVDWSTLPDVQVLEARTGQWGDEPDKQMRFTSRNLVLAPPPLPNAKPSPNRHRSQFNYPDADARDRARSSWAAYTNMCAAIAAAPRRHEGAAPLLDFRAITEEIAVHFHQKGYTVPNGYDADGSRPPTWVEDDYRYERGPGHGRCVESVLPRSLKGAADDQDELRRRRAERFALEVDGDRALQAVRRARAEHAARTTALRARSVKPSSPEKSDGDGSPPSDGPPTNAAPDSDCGDGMLADLGHDPPVDASYGGEPSEVIRYTNGETTAGAASVSADRRPKEVGRLNTANADRLGVDEVVVVPIDVTDHEPMAYLPIDSNELLVLDSASRGAGYIGRAEALVRNMLASARAMFGYRAGTGDDGQKLVVVATEGHDGAAVESAAERRQGRSTARGALAVWCTLAMLGGGMQGNMAKLALTSAAHYMGHGAMTTAVLKGEPRLRAGVGLQAGRTGDHTPVRPAILTDDGVTPRQLIGRTASGLVELQRSLREDDGDHSEYYQGWADSLTPLKIGEVPLDLLDQPLALQHHLVRQSLFSEPLPVYELPWLERMPAQRFESRAGCQDYAPHTVYDLIDADAQRDVTAWVRRAARDNACLEDLGPACDRRDKPSAIAIGQDQFHRCAKGYVWDCSRRGQPCTLLDYDAPMQTDFNLPYLRKLLEGYPDQRLASNVLEGVRLEADVELQMVLMP